MPFLRLSLTLLLGRRWLTPFFFPTPDFSPSLSCVLTNIIRRPSLIGWDRTTSILARLVTLLPFVEFGAWIPPGLALLRAWLLIGARLMFLACKWRRRFSSCRLGRNLLSLSRFLVSCAFPVLTFLVRKQCAMGMES